MDSLALILGAVGNTAVIIGSVAGLFSRFKRWVRKEIQRILQDGLQNHETRIARLEGKHDARSDF